MRLPGALTSALSGAAALLEAAPQLCSGGGAGAGALAEAALAGGAALAVAVSEVALNFSANGSSAAAALAARGGGGGVGGAARRRGGGGGGRRSGGGPPGAPPLHADAHSFLDCVLAEAFACVDAFVSGGGGVGGGGTTAGAAAAAGVTASLLRAAHALAPPAAAAALARLLDAFLVLLMGAARQSEGVRAALIARSVPARLAAPLLRRCVGAAASPAAAAAAPLPALTAMFRLLAAVAAPGDNFACGAVLKAEGVVDAAVAALGLRRPAGGGGGGAPPAAASAARAALRLSGAPPHRGGASPPRAPQPHVNAALAELRIAAATLLAHAATRKGNDGEWMARPHLMALTVACLEDPVLGVRAAAAAALAALCRNSVRLRATPGLPAALAAAAAASGAELEAAQRGGGGGGGGDAGGAPAGAQELLSTTLRSLGAAMVP